MSQPLVLLADSVRRPQFTARRIARTFAGFILALTCSAARSWQRHPLGSEKSDSGAAYMQTEATVSSINLSHDLIRLGIAPQNLTPESTSVDSRPLFEAAVKYAQGHHAHLLTVDHGTYYLLTPHDAIAYLRLTALSDLTLDLADSTIYLADAFRQGLALVDSNRVTLRNFRIDFLVPPYTQVRLESVDPERRALHYSPLPNWAEPVTFNKMTTPATPTALWAVIFRNGNIVPGTSRMAVIGPIAKGTIQLASHPAPWVQSSVLKTIKPGDTIVVTLRGGGPLIFIYRSESVTLASATIYGSSAIAVMLASTSHSTVDHVRVIPRPESGLISANADGIHVNMSGADNHVRNCFITRTLDDAIAIDSLNLATVQSQNGVRQIVVTRSGFLRFPNHTAVNFVDPVSAKELSGAIIVAQDPPDSDAVAYGGSVRLTLDHDLPRLGPGFGMTFANPQQRGAGSSIEANVIEEVPFGRGIWIGGAEGVAIERNEIGPTSNGGIVVSQDTKWYPSPPAHDISIRNNKIVGSLGPMASGSGSHIALGAVIVESINSTEFSTLAPNTNINIEGNYIADSGRSGIWIGGLSGGTVRDNCIIRWNQHPELPIFGLNAKQGMQLTKDFAQPLVIHDSPNVVTRNNSTAQAPACGYNTNP